MSATEAGIEAVELEYKQHFSRAMVQRGIAFQIREMRQVRGWTQEYVAELTGRKQETISELENPDHGGYTIKTLHALADAFGVALQVRFVRHGVIEEYARNLTPDDLSIHIAPVVEEVET